MLFNPELVIVICMESNNVMDTTVRPDSRSRDFDPNRDRPFLPVEV